MEALLLVAEHDGPTDFARIGIMRTLNRRVELVFDPTRKEHHWGTPQAGEGSMTKRKAIFGNTYNAAILAVTVGAIWGSILGLGVHALFVAIKD